MSLLEAKALVKHFPLKAAGFSRRKGVVRAVDGVSFSVEPGEVFALVGESGCGKSTLGRLLLRLEDPTSGAVTFDGENLLSMNRARLKRFRREAQIIYQDPYSALNPRKRVGQLIEEPLVIHRVGSPAERKDRVAWLLAQVGLLPEHARRYPHEFSGGQRQRIAIARAIIRNPSVLLLDEATSALDQTTEAALNKTLMTVSKGRTMISSTHRLTSVVDMDEIIVISGGKAIERGTHAQLLAKGGMYAQLWNDQLHKKHDDPADAEDDDDEDD